MPRTALKNVQRKEPHIWTTMHANTGIDTGPKPTGGAYGQVYDGVGQEVCTYLHAPLDPGGDLPGRALYLPNEMALLCVYNHGFCVQFCARSG